MEADSVRMREHLYSRLEWQAVASLLDVGCGKGGDLRRMASFALEGAQFAGIDSSGAAIETARAATAGNAGFSWHQADVSLGLPFADGAFDALFSLNLLECVADKNALLREMARVLRPGGQIVCAHWDWDTQTINGADKALVRKIVQTFCDWQQPWMPACDGWMGRRLWPTFQRSGLFTGRIETYTLANTEFAPGWFGYEQVQSFGALARRGLIAQEDYMHFCDDVAAQAARGEYFYSLTLYIYVGKKL